MVCLRILVNELADSVIELFEHVICLFFRLYGVDCSLDFVSGGICFSKMDKVVGGVLDGMVVIQVEFMVLDSFLG